MTSKSKVIGSTIASRLKDASDDQYHVLFTNFLMILLDAASEQSKSGGDSDRVDCLARLLRRLCDTGGIGDAVLAYAVSEDKGVEPFLSFGSSDVETETLTKVTDEFRQSPDILRNYDPASGVEEFSTNTLDNSLENTKEAFATGILVRNSMLPLLRGPGDHVVIVFLMKLSNLDRAFLTEMMKLFFPAWIDAFVAHHEAFGRAVSKCTRGGTIDERMNLLDLAIRAHSWLGSPEVCNALEKSMPSTQTHLYDSDEETDSDRLAAKILDFAKVWDWCQERPWPCKGPYQLESHPILDWFLWRLGRNDDELSKRIKTVDASCLFIVKELKAKEAPIQLDQILWKTASVDVLQGLASEDALPHPNTDAFLLAKHSLGRFSASVLSDAPHTPESIDATIWALAQYGYKALDIDPQLHLASHMRHGARGEPSLHMMKEFYRDHFFHTIEVCFLGLLLMKTRQEGAIKSAFEDGSKILRQWYVAALLHDMGYAVDVVKCMRDWLDFFASGSFNALGKNLSQALTGMMDSDGIKDFYESLGFSAKDKPWEDHGLLGAQHLQTLVDDVKLRHNLVHAIEAIAKHNCTNIPIKYKEGLESLDSLLVLCDLLQTWRRPQFPHFSGGPAWMMSVMSGQHRHVKPETARANLWSNVSFVGTGKSVCAEFSGPLVLRLEFDEEVNRDSYVFNIWLDVTRNLQRVDFRDLPHDILVQIVTPTYIPAGSSTPKRQMDRLRDAAVETHMAYLDTWFPKEGEEHSEIPEVTDTTANIGMVNRRLSYHVEYNSSEPEPGSEPDKKPEREPMNAIREMLCFSLKMFTGERNLMTESLSQFRKDIQNWRLFSQDRTFQGDYSPWRHKKR